MKKAIFITALLIAATTAFSQSADIISKILGAENLTYGQAAYLAKSAAANGVSEQEAFDSLKRAGAIPDKANATDSITMKNFANICAKTWNIEGSLFLMAFKNGRYALRQMRADGVVPASTDPDKKLSGRDALNIISECVEKYPLKGGAQ